MNESLELAFADLTYVDPFIDQSCYVFGQLFDWQVEFDRPRAKTESVPTYEVTGFISLRGGVDGIVAVSLPREFACVLASRLLRKDVLCVGDDVVDAAGELVNMIVGRASACLGRGHIRMGLPRVLVGKQRPIDYPSGVRPLVVEMDAEVNCFTLELGIKLAGEHAAAARPTGALSDTQCFASETSAPIRPFRAVERF